MRPFGLTGDGGIATLRPSPKDKAARGTAGLTDTVEARGEPIHLLLAADAKYGAYAGIAIASVLRSNPECKFDVHLFSNGVRRGDLRKMSGMLARAGSRLVVYNLAGALRANPHLVVRRHLNQTAYARLMMGELLPEPVRRVVYLDCDVICTGDIAPLWRLADTIPIAGAVIDRAGEGWKRQLRLPPEAPYFNSGVLLVNLDAWRTRDLGREILDWIAANPDKIELADQDAINAVLWEAITPLPDRWNLQVGLNSGPLPEHRLTSAALLHFNGPRKPWEYRFSGPGADIFRAQKRASPWRYKPPASRLAYRLGKSLRKRIGRWQAESSPFLGQTHPPIHLLLAADAKYGAYAGIAVASVLRANPRERFEVHLFSNGVRRRDLGKLDRMLRRAGSRLAVYDIAGRLASNPHLVGQQHLSKTTYARLFLGELLPRSVDRILYLDCDVICTGEIAPLWQLAATVPVIAGVPDRLGDSYKARLGLPASAAYVNAGMLPINVAAWRERDLGREILDWVAANPDKLALVDQDAINFCLSGEIAALPDCWNLQIGDSSGPLPDERLAGARLLHYTGPNKPWQHRFRGLGAEIFLTAKRASPWRFKLPTFRATYKLNKALNKRLARWRAPPRPAPV
jgi:lipopolysaccharide biosynthesis glycosyltransferase